MMILVKQWVETQRYEWTKLQRTATSDNDEPDIAVQSNSAGVRPANPRLTPERLRRLESIGFEWKVKNKMKRYYDKQWDAMFQKLLEFKQNHGHCNVVSFVSYFHARLFLPRIASSMTFCCLFKLLLPLSQNDTLII
jgi:hypothetical protein